MLQRGLAVAVLAGAAAQTVAASAAPHIVAVRTATPPVIDGRLDDPAWRRARFIGDFRQSDPHWGARPSRRTEVAFVFDGHNLYVGARMYAAGEADVQAIMTRRDVSGNAERIIVSLDPYRDRRTAYSFAVTAAGVRVDWYHPDDNAFARDMSFDPVWEARTHVGPHGWTAEMRIPFSQLRFPAGDRQIWGVNLNRYMPQDNEDVFWIVVPRNTVAWSSYFGELRGIRGVEPSMRVELLPYLATDATLTSRSLLAPGDPFADATQIGVRGGVDLKLGLGPNLTLDATFNPDFGQVEADPAVVNLSAFETIYTEQRPFFVEGDRLLRGIGPSYYYSRRIGGPPHAAPDADFADTPTATRILGAAKLTGRLRSGLSVGALAAVTQATYADTFDVSSDARGRQLVEPLAGYGVLRLQQELGADASLIGASLAATARDLASDDPLAASLAGQAVAGGIDWRLRSTGGVYEVSGHLGGSVVHGEPAAIEAIQRTSAHYFQRPDQGHVRVDPTQRTLAGVTASLAARKRSGRWRSQLQAGLESPGYETNDTGQLMSADDIWLLVSGGYVDDDPGEVLRSYRLGLVGWQETNFGGTRKPAAMDLRGSATFHNYVSAGLAAELQLPGFSDDATRGGPLMELGTGISLRANVGTQRSGSRWRWRASGRYQARETGDTGWTADASITATPWDRVELRLGPHLRRVVRNRQYVATLPDGPAETFGQRYVFGTVALSELSVQVRAQVVLTPDLSVSLYAEPFVSSGDYTAFGQLAAPGARQLTPVTYADDIDFTVLSLRSTLVVRWELSPGSTVYAVWQQDRSDDLDHARRAGGTALLDSLTPPGRHTLVLKLSYWLPLG